jgi:hypothetical protein
LSSVAFKVPATAAQLLVAVAGLTGALLAAVVSLAGVLVKAALDERTERRAEVDAAHNRQLQDAAESRLKLEAAVGALGLFSTPGGQLTPAAQRAGALFTLSSLGQHELAVALLRLQLPSGEVTADAAADLLDRALKGGDETVIDGAVSLMLNNAGVFVEPSGFSLPYCIAYPRPELDQVVRDWGPIIVGRMLLQHPVSVWRTMQEKFNVLLGALVEFWEFESVPRIKLDAGVILDSVLQAFPASKRIHRPNRTIELTEVTRNLSAFASREGASQSACAMADRLKEWSAKTGDEPPARPARPQ